MQTPDDHPQQVILPTHWTNFTTGTLCKAILELSPVDYEFWLSTAEYKHVFLVVIRELLTRFLKSTSKRAKDMTLLTDDKLAQPFREFFSPSSNVKETPGQLQERNAMMLFYRSLIAVMQAYVNDSMSIFHVFEFPADFLPKVFLTELESAFFHYITWIEVNQRARTEMAVRIIEYHRLEKQRYKADTLGLLPLYRRVLELVWDRPLVNDDYHMLDAISSPSE